MSRVADTIVSYLMNPQSNSKHQSNKRSMPELPRAQYSMSKIDGLVYDSAELDAIFKCVYEITFNGVDRNDLDRKWFPTRCREGP
jgi:hypothetical protein